LESDGGEIAEFEEDEEQAEGRDVVERDQEVRYYIDVDWYEGEGLSFSDIANARMCNDCQRRLDEEVEEKYPVLDPKTKRLSYELRRFRRGARPLQILRDCCSRKGGFITPELPILEAVFRIVLANANQPMPLEHIRDQLREWCPTGRCQWLLLPLDSMRRLLDNDRAYGLRRHELLEAA